MTGISEILVLVLLIACILILPRMVKGPESDLKNAHEFRITKISVKVRLGIVLSILYPAILALFLKPWESGSYIIFLSAGIIPVVFGWSLVWIMAGKK